MPTAPRLFVLDSTETPVLQAGLEYLGGRRTINSVNYEDGDGLDSAIVHASKILPMNRIDEKQREVGLDLVYGPPWECYHQLTELMAV